MSPPPSTTYMSSAPPAAAPPPPPPSSEGSSAHVSYINRHDDENDQLHDPLLTPQSYQRGGSINSNHSRAAAPPVIRHYPDATLEDPRSFFVVRGDASLRPNTGETNSYDTAMFGLALHELLEHIRIANIVSSLASISLLLVSWVWKLLTGQVSRLVLSCYLAFLASLLLLVELIGIWHVASVDDFLKQNFGLLRHPVGRVIYIVLLSTLCFSIGGWFYWVVGGLYLATAAVLLYAWSIYPELRRPFEGEDDDDEEVGGVRGNAKRGETHQSVSWSAYASTFSSYVKTSSETAALLGSAMRRG